jgi:serine/threonine protein kinase
VYRARDTRLDRIVAIKTSKIEFSERFEREARAVAALNHSSICTLHDVGPDYLVMEYIEGTPLKGPLPVDQALKYAIQICDALDAAHKKGITHRDLKPANILVTRTGIKLLDFGLAKLGAAGTGQAVAPAGDATFTMALTGKNPALWMFSRTVVMRKAMRPSGAGLATVVPANGASVAGVRSMAGDVTVIVTFSVWGEFDAPADVMVTVPV